MSDARNILGLDNNNNKEVNISLVSKEDGMSYIRDLNRVRSKQDILLESDSLEYQLNSIMIANEAVTNDMVLESERLQLVKELMISENGVSLESANDIMDSYISEGAKWDKFINAVKMKVQQFIKILKSLLNKIIPINKELKYIYPSLVSKYKNSNVKLSDIGLHGAVIAKPNFLDIFDECNDKNREIGRKITEYISKPEQGEEERAEFIKVCDEFINVNKGLESKIENSCIYEPEKTISEYLSISKSVFEGNHVAVVVALKKNVSVIENILKEIPDTDYAKPFMDFTKSSLSFYQKMYSQYLKIITTAKSVTQTKNKDTEYNDGAKN